WRCARPPLSASHWFRRESASRHTAIGKSVLSVPSPPPKSSRWFPPPPSDFAAAPRLSDPPHPCESHCSPCRPHTPFPHCPPRCPQGDKIAPRSLSHLAFRPCHSDQPPSPPHPRPISLAPSRRRFLIPSPLPL